MNERIRELYKQAHVPDTAIDPSNNMPYETMCFSADKFAELIIQECLLAISQTPIESDEIGTMVRCHNQVEQHFGVEE
jgi:hypothetical protein